MTEETSGVTTPYTIDEKREMLAEAAESAEAVDAIGELSDEQVETAFEEHAEKVAAENASEDGTLPQPAEANEPSTGAVVERDVAPPDEIPDAPRPTVGRIVLVAQEIGGRRSTTIVSVPAIVTGTADHPEGAFGLELDSPWHIHATSFEPGADPLSRTNLPYSSTGLEHGTWRWPERV